MSTILSDLVKFINKLIRSKSMTARLVYPAETESNASFIRDLESLLYNHLSVEQRVNYDENVKEIELTPNDLEYSCYDEDIIFLDRLIEEHILLSIPMKPLCKEGCLGLCQQCGLNLNSKVCTCPKNPTGSPFERLKDIVI